MALCFLSRTTAAITPRLYRSFATGSGKGSIWKGQHIDHLFENNLAWRKEKLASDPDIFSRQATGQTPRYLLLGCSDSRVAAEEIMGLKQGEVFVHRNVANMAVNTDLNFQSVLFYAVNVLKVKDILVLGHYGCAGCKAASENEGVGMLDLWLQNVRDVRRLHDEELSSISCSEEREKRLVELNVQEQCFNLYANSIVQQRQAKKGKPRIHGLVYDISQGLLKRLDINFKSVVHDTRNIYTVADFKQPMNIKNVLNNAEEDAPPENLVLICAKSGEDLPYSLRCTPSTSLLEVKEAIKELTGATIKQQVLTYNGEILSDADATLAGIGIENIAEVELTVEIVPTKFI